MRKRYTEKQREDLVGLVGAGKATVVEAAGRLGVTVSTAYSWARGRGRDGEEDQRHSEAAKASSLVQPRFVRVVPRGYADGELAVRVGGAEIRVRRDFDPELLRTVVAALGGGE